MSDAKPHYFRPDWIEPTDALLTCDICIYGATAAGVIAAVTATSQGKSVVVLHPGLFIGGMTTGGLGLTDFGETQVIGGRSRQFYRDIGRHYHREEEWRFEPHIASRVQQDYLQASGARLELRQFIARTIVEQQQIREIVMLSGLRVRATVYIDTSYEGDLMALAGVTHTVGREPNSAYGETINGVQVRDKHQFTSRVDPFVQPGNPASGVLPLINETDASPEGSGDHRIQAYNFRVCMCDDPGNQISWQRPERFDPILYELSARWCNSEKDEYNEILLPDGEIRKFDRLAVHSKTDTNNHGAVSSDFIGANYAWPESGYAAREKIFQAHVDYQRGLYWFLSNDSRIPSRYRDAFGKWGLAKDEFTQTGGWPHQLYVREARRMIGDYVVSEHDTQHRSIVPDPVGCGSYAMDSHNCQRVIRDGRVINEGDVQLLPAGPYAISYRSIIPRARECANLLVPVCLSATHIAYGSIRMEPVFMVLAESAALAASLAIDHRVAAHAVPYMELRSLLEAARQVIAV